MFLSIPQIAAEIDTDELSVQIAHNRLMQLEQHYYGHTDHFTPEGANKTGVLMIAGAINHPGPQRYYFSHMAQITT